MKTRYSLAAAIFIIGVPAVAAEVRPSQTEIACTTPDQEAQRLSVVPPPYPYSALLFCIEGHARFEFTVNPDGTTSDIEVLESMPEGVFNGTGDVIRFWTHEPACRDGEAVARKATTKFDFWLEQFELRKCPENLPDDLLDVQVALFSLYQQTDAAIRNQSSPLTPMPVESALEEPFASIERAHRRHLNDRLEREREWRRYPLWMLRKIIDPPNLADEQGFSASREVLDIFESGRLELYWEWPKTVKALRGELRGVSETPGVTPEVYEILIGGDPRQPEGGITPNHDMMNLEASVFSAHRELLDWLELHSHEWAVADGEFRFASDGLKQAYQRRIDEIKELWQRWDQEFSTPREVYWSGF